MISPVLLGFALRCDDVARCAKVAPIDAVVRADAMLGKGDMDGYAVWKWVLKVVEKLPSEERMPGASVQYWGRSRTGDNRNSWIAYGVGIRAARTIELMKLDLDYFDQDDGS